MIEMPKPREAGRRVEMHRLWIHPQESRKHTNAANGSDPVGGAVWINNRSGDRVNWGLDTPFSHSLQPDARRAVPMSLNHDVRSPAYGRTPSGWHDDAGSRDAGHDDMVADHMRYVNSGKLASEGIRNYYSADSSRFFLHYAEIEFPFIGLNGRVSGFADMALKFQTKARDEDAESRAFRPEYLWLFLEFKPRILSVGAIIRQCKATDVLAERHFARSHNPNVRKPRIETRAVIYGDDPKAELLKEMYDGLVMCLPRPGAEGEP